MSSITCRLALRLNSEIRKICPQKGNRAAVGNDEERNAKPKTAKEKRRRKQEQKNAGHESKRGEGAACRQAVGDWQAFGHAVEIRKNAGSARNSSTRLKNYLPPVSEQRHTGANSSTA
jgi:hypothetical protein